MWALSIVGQCVDTLLNTTSELAIKNIEEKLAETESQIKDVEKEIMKLSTGLKALPTKQEIIDRLTAIKNGSHEDADVLKDLVKCVYLHEDKTIIYYSILPSLEKPNVETVLDIEGQSQDIFW